MTDFQLIIKTLQSLNIQFEASGKANLIEISDPDIIANTDGVIFIIFNEDKSFSNLEIWEHKYTKGE